jgi:hypothetical protein
MFDAGTANVIAQLDLSKIVMAIGSLGTAAYGVVDVTKGFGGGVSNRGFGDIRDVVSKLIPATVAGTNSTAPALALPSALATLRANWLNGMALGDQKSVAKALIKLNLTPATANAMAAATGVDATLLTSVAGKLAAGNVKLEPAETDVYGRFDLLLSTLLDQGYQRGDQRYRNSAKLLAVPVAVALAFLGALALDGRSGLTLAEAGRALVGGLLATPLAPVAKDVASSIQAGAKLAQAWK